MRRLQSFLTILLCLCLLVTPAAARAADDDVYDTALITRTLTSWLGAQKNITLGDVAVGESIPIYTVGERSFSANARSAYHPVYNGEAIIGILSAHKAPADGYTYALGTAWSATLATTLSGSEGGVYLIRTEAGLFLGSANGITLAQAAPDTTDEQVEAMEADLLAMDRENLKTYTADAGKWKPYKT